jgi:hypothetical protein
MRKEPINIFLASAFCALIGTIFARKIGYHYWWLGIPIGGIAGYIAYDVKAFARGVSSAYRAAAGWHPTKTGLATTGWALATYLTVTFWVCIGLQIVEIIRGAYYPSSHIYFDLFQMKSWIAYALIAVGFNLPSGITMLFFGGYRTDKKKEAEEFRDAATSLFPPVVLFWKLPYGLMRLFFFILPPLAWKATVALVKFSGRFGWELWIRIHSNNRVTCLMGASIGVFVNGRTTTNMFVGAIVGGLFGVLDYYAIRKLWLEPKGYIVAR